MLSKKHYEAIAKIIRDNTITYDGEEVLLIKDKIIVGLAQFFLNDNKNFDLKRFKESCGVVE